MMRARSINHRGRRHLKGWQLTAMVGVVGALSVAGCSSSSSSSSASSSSSSSSAAPAVVSARLDHVGLDRVVGEPHLDQLARRHPDGADQGLQQGVPEHPRHAGVGADGHRHQPGHASHGDLGRLGHPGRVHGRRDLARPVRRAPAGRAAVDYLPASYWAQFAPGLVAGASYKGKVYGSPLFEDQGFMYYRKDLLAKEHMSPPTTWEQLRKRGRAAGQKAGLRQVRLRLAGRLV